MTPRGTTGSGQSRRGEGGEESGKKQKGPRWPLGMAEVAAVARTVSLLVATTMMLMATANGTQRNNTRMWGHQ